MNYLSILKHFPPGYRERALLRIQERGVERGYFGNYSNQYQCIMDGIAWHKTKEGAVFWGAMCGWTQDQPLPDLPPL